MFIEFVPTFFVPVGCVATTLDDECRSLVKGKGKFLMFARKYRFFFDVRVTDTGMVDIKLRDDLSHPKRGAADAKYIMTDAGEHQTYTVRPEFIRSMESIDLFSESVAVRAPQAPPSVHVQMEERVPVVDRLKSLVPKEFTLVEEVEEKIPEDVLFHPYFDCQGGLPAIASKMPDLFQVVDGFIRRRPSHLAPLSTNSLALRDSAIPSVAEKVQEMVCGPGVPQWVSLTTIYETLTLEEKRSIKKQFKSFAGFLRAHGASVAISQDTLKVAKWIPPTASKQAAATTAMPPVCTQDQSPSSQLPVRKVFTPTHVINELFDKFPRNKSLSLTETLRLLTPDMRASLPKNIVGWFDSNRSYFVVDNNHETNPELVFIRRATDTVPLDLALALYPLIPAEGISQVLLLEKLSEAVQDVVRRLGLPNVVDSLADWLELVDGDVFRKKSEAELENAIQQEESKRRRIEESSEDGDDNIAASEAEQRLARPLKFEGGMVQERGGHRHSRGQ
jgi:hypothetical protein